MKVIEEREFENGSRVMKIDINGKKIETPSYFPQIARVGDPRDFLDATTILESLREPQMKRIGGVVLEAHSTFKIMDKDLRLIKQARLFKRKSGEKFFSFYNMLKEKSMAFFIDPNLDRLPLYKDDFKKTDSKLDYNEKLFTKGILELLESGQQIKDFSVFRDIEFVRKVFQFQKRFKSDELMAPYIAIDIKGFYETLEMNKDLYERSLDVWRIFFNDYGKPLPTICVNSNMLNMPLAKKGEWLNDLVGAYERMGADAYFFKVSDFNTQSKDQKYDAILDIVRLIKNRIKKPLICLNMNEFAYILTREGADGYSSRFGRPSSRDVPVRGSRTREQILETLPGYYYLPVKMEFVKKSQLKTLPCNCPFCRHYDGIPVKQINDNEWKSLRLHHYLWTKNSEMDQLLTELKKNSLRAALRDMFARSSEWKNFVKYT